MTAAILTLALAAAVALLMLANSSRARCRMHGHAWGRPFTDDKRRQERCERCFTVRDHVFVVPTAATVDALSIDGTAPVSVVVAPRIVAVEPDADAQAARAEWIESVKAGAARRRGEGGLTSGRVQ